MLMFGSTALDVVIGLVFVFLLYSLLASIVQEIFSSWIGLRARILKKAIVRMLNDGQDSSSPSFFIVILLERFRSFWRVLIQRDPEGGTFARKFYHHPLIKYLGENTYNSKPAYLSAQNFSKVLVDLLTGMKNQPGTDYAKHVQTFLEPENPEISPVGQPNNLLNVPQPAVSETAKKNKSKKKPKAPKVSDTEAAHVQKETYLFLQSLWADAQGDMTRFKVLLEGWYNDTMQRTSGWYKQYTQFFLFFIGLGIAVAFNVDSIGIAEKLAKDPELRAQVVQMADTYVKEHPNLEAELKQAKRQAVTDSTGTSQMAVDSVQTLLDTQKELYHRADSLINGDIKNLNDVLGLGYESFSDGPFWPRVGTALHNTLCTSQGWLRTLGWILTALALSLGAPFWFDLLNKLMQLRGAVKKESSGGNTESQHPAENPIIRKG